MAQYAKQQTLSYSFFIKRAIIESLQAAFNVHPDPTVLQAKVAVDTTHSRFKLPAVIVKYYERELPNAGVAHVEYLPSPTNPDPLNPTIFIKYYQRMYKGDIAFDVYGESSVDRDLVRDALVEVLTMTDTTTPGDDFINRFYNYVNQTPYGKWHFPVLNLDKLTGYGEQQTIAPWMPEDTLVYSVSYRVPIFGEFYSLTPTFPSGEGLLQEVDVYPWIPDIDPPPEDSNYPEDWYRFTGWPPGLMRDI